MVSTYLAYNSIVRNLRQSMTRVAQQTDVSRNAAYYKENIGKVKTVDDFLKNDRLYQYAMKAYGLEDMTYAKAFMKKVLQSDLSDPNSYANKLVDKRYREFAAAFSFGGSEAAIAQSANQTDEMIGLYTATVTRQVDAIDEDTRYYNLTIGSVTNVDQLLNDDRLRTYVFAAFGIDDSQWSRDTIKNVLSSDPSDPNSYVNTVWVSRLDDIDHRLDQAKADLTDASSKITSYMTQLAQPGADMNDLRAKITMERARLSKSNADISSYNDAIAMIGRYVDLAVAFEFSPDGTLPSGVSAQTDANRAKLPITGSFSARGRSISRRRRRTRPWQSTSSEPSFTRWSRSTRSYPRQTYIISRSRPSVSIRRKSPRPRSRPCSRATRTIQRATSIP